MQRSTARIECLTHGKRNDSDQLFKSAFHHADQWGTTSPGKSVKSASYFVEMSFTTRIAFAEKPDICSFSQSPRTMVFQFQLALPHNSRKGWKLYGFRSGVMYALYSVIDFSFLLVSSPIVGLFTIFFNSILNPCFIRTRRWQVHWVRDWKGSRSILDRIKHSKQVLPTSIWQIEQFNWRRFLVR